LVGAALQIDGRAVDGCGQGDVVRACVARLGISWLLAGFSNKKHR